MEIKLVIPIFIFLELVEKEHKCFLKHFVWDLAAHPKFIQGIDLELFLDRSPLQTEQRLEVS